ncbi:hypothetical protein P5V15_014755 [Pogonomyrmex californicus]
MCCEITRRNTNNSALQELFEFTATILDATAEEKLNGSQPTKVYNNEKARGNQKLECHKCGRLEHLARDCRSNRYTTRYSLLRVLRPANINNIEKYCSYCKKVGHKRDECWSLNGCPRKEQPKQTRQDNGKERQINTANNEKE